MKKLTVLLVGIALLASNSAFARETFFYRWQCIDNGVSVYSPEQHENVSTTVSFATNNRDCDTVCIQLIGETSNDIKSTSLKRYSGDLDYSNGNTQLLSNYGSYDHRLYGSYCWDDWTNDYWATYYNSTNKVLRKTVFSFYDAEDGYHFLTLVPHAQSPAPPVV